MSETGIALVENEISFTPLVLDEVGRCPRETCLTGEGWGGGVIVDWREWSKHGESKHYSISEQGCPSGREHWPRAIHALNLNAPRKAVCKQDQSSAAEPHSEDCLVCFLLKSQILQNTTIQWAETVRSVEPYWHYESDLPELPDVSSDVVTFEKGRDEYRRSDKCSIIWRYIGVFSFLYQPSRVASVKTRRQHRLQAGSASETIHQSNPILYYLVTARCRSGVPGSKSTRVEAGGEKKLSESRTARGGGLLS